VSFVVDWGGGKKLEYFFGGGICVTAAGKSVPMAAWADYGLSTP